MNSFSVYGQNNKTMRHMINRWYSLKDWMLVLELQLNLSKWLRENNRELKTS